MTAPANDPGGRQKDASIVDVHGTVQMTGISQPMVADIKKKKQFNKSLLKSVLACLIDLEGSCRGSRQCRGH